MSDLHDKLNDLERQMSALCSARDDRIGFAEETIRRANTEFDRDAVPLGRKINAIRVELALEEKPVITTPKARVTRKRKHDPEWSQEDIGHWYELQQREAQNGR